MADLKARLSAYLRRVRRGHSLTVMDRDTPIARLVPYQDEAMSLVIRHPLPNAPRFHEIPRPPRFPVDVDIVALLFEERQGER